MTPPKILRCAIYTRKSTEEGLEQAFNSLDAQREACDAYVKSQAGEGWIALPTAYDDGGFSGGNMERPGLRALMADLDRGLIDVVVVYKVDRLTRSLADFAKIVERFDKRNVSFVSVTQAFNTTSSMGRLTLNVLLSFAQFEREVTSERIRDKIAASKKKGMYLGGTTPFGYAVIDKKLVPHETEAPKVRAIYARYLELGSVRLLRDELQAEGLVSQSWTSRHGHERGGKPFDRGALYHLLQNRLYIGEIRHKTERYKGQHEAIVPIDLFDKVQAQLAATRGREPGEAKTALLQPLTGIIFDAHGRRMSPSYGIKNGQRYRYYVSRRPKSADHTEPTIRVPAISLESLVLDRLSRLTTPPGQRFNPETTEPLPPDIRTLIGRVEIGPEAIALHIRRAQLDIVLAQPGSIRSKAPGLGDLRQRVDVDDHLSESDTIIILTVPAGPLRRGGAIAIARPGGEDALRKPKPDPALLKAIARAHGWVELMLTGKADTLRAAAAIEGVQERYVRRVIPLAFLSPKDLKAVLDGRQSPNLSVDRVARDGVRAMW